MPCLRIASEFELHTAMYLLQFVTMEDERRLKAVVPCDAAPVVLFVDERQYAGGPTTAQSHAVTDFVR